MGGPEYLTQNASQHKLLCLLKEIRILKSSSSLKSPTPARWWQFDTIFFFPFFFFLMVCAKKMYSQGKIMYLGCWNKTTTCIKQFWFSSLERSKEHRIRSHARKHGWTKVIVWIMKSEKSHSKCTSVKFHCLLKEIWILKSSCSLKSPTLARW